MQNENSDYSDDIIYMTHADDIEEAEKLKH